MKKQETAVNVSSGAEKVETVEKKVKKQPQSNTRAKRTVETVTEEKIDVKKMNAQSTDGRAERESEAAKARVAAALKKQEEKAKRAEEKAKEKAKRAAEKAKHAKMTAAEREAEAEKRAAERKALAEKRAAEKKARIEKRKAEKQALIEKRKEEREARIRERAHAKANRSQARSKAKAQKRTNKKEHGEKRQSHVKGYGGWLAAVISLGVVTLGLTTAVTLGAIDMKDTKNGVMMSHRSTAYEMIGIMENVDNDLDRARVSASPVQQGRILTDLLVQARLAELDLEKMPITAEADRNLTSFINRVATESERMLAKLRRGETLSTEDEATLQHLYEVNHEIRTQLDEFAAKMTDDDIMRYIKDGEGGMASVLEGLENLTLEENRAALEGKKPEMQGAGKERSVPAPEEGGSPALDPKKAEELCTEYFSDYKINEFQCVGETTARGYMAYNVQGYDDKGTLLFAEVDYKNGELIRFDYYEPCEGETFDMDNTKRIAEEFLQKLGYENMTAVRMRENGTDIDFTYVYEQNGTVYYPDTVHVKVCRARGVVTGLDASKYLRSHQQRSDPTTKITLEQAQNNLREGVEVEASRLAVVQTARGERAAYEFLCSYKGEKYFIYTDAVNGDEISIVNVKNIG
ncbi:MAG: germination protein YpeB [Clostridia bacterium]|nr:germination protein YpeB [Clostridia bacterium]